MNNIYKINNDKFKSIYFSINFTMNSDKKVISQNSLLASVMGKSCKRYSTQKEIQKYLYSLYGANFDIGIEKLGDLYNIEFRCECINKKFLPNNEDVVNDVLMFLYNMIFEPKMDNNCFDEKVVSREKNFVINKIKEVKDDKLRYGIRKAEEIMCKGDAFATYVYGDEEEVKSTSNIDLYNCYKNMIKNSYKTFIISGNLDGYSDIYKKVEEVFGVNLENNNNNKLLFNQNNTSHEVLEEKEIQDTVQSVIAYGLRISDVNKDDFYKLSVYNSLLGGNPSSKLFQNFREKESLAYTVRSRYYRFKNMIIIYAGIQNKNYERAKVVLENEINSIKHGNVTDEEFNASKESIISDLREWKDSKISLSKMLMANIVIDKENILSIEDMIENMKKVSKSDVIEIAKNVTVEKIFFLGGEEHE